MGSRLFPGRVPVTHTKEKDDNRIGAAADQEHPGGVP